MKAATFPELFQPTRTCKSAINPCFVHLYVSTTSNQTEKGGLWDLALSDISNGKLEEASMKLLMINTTSSQYVLGRTLAKGREENPDWIDEEIRIKRDVLRRTQNNSCDALYDMTKALLAQNDAVAAKTVARSCVSLCVDHHLCYKILSKAVLKYTNGIENLVVVLEVNCAT